MPWHIGTSAQCPDSKPHAVVKDKDGSVAGCHATRAKAVAQLRALYRSECGLLLQEASAQRTAQQVINQLVRARAPHVQQFENIMTTEFRLLGEHVAEVGQPLLSTSEFQEKWRTDLTLAQQDNLVQQILGTAKLREWASNRWTPKFIEHYERMQNTTARLLIRAGLVTNLTQSTINRFLDAGGRRAGLVDIVGDTRAALFRVVAQGIDGGLNPFETAKLIRDFVPEGRFVNAGANYRASLIARTETLHAQRMASLERYRSNRIETLIAYDGDGDEDCAARDGQEFTVDEAEVETMTTHPQCVLAFGPKVVF